MPDDAQAPVAGPGRWPDDAPLLEADLVARARAGDAAAFDVLVRRHRDRLYGVALRMTGDPEDAQDVVQDALEHAWRAVPRFRQDARLSTWLVRIVINRCRDLRRARPQAAVPPDDTLADAGTPLEAVVEGRGRQDAVVAAIARLPFDQRAALVLHTFDGRSQAEVARLLGTTESAVKVRIHRARRALLATLHDWG
ncbi:RNA polymerase sigma factor [Puerhibacterium puerhi]|uniref:RNA polymerase sigma factor n=1 Tax=Puerhibacterium puerhi TaxID=2692623 RepID=UPI001359F2EA|nr:sigma-70 family RNA polymerase sigma factor [Puerhibacterium puerhi]